VDIHNARTKEHNDQMKAKLVKKQQRKQQKTANRVCSEITRITALNLASGSTTGTSSLSRSKVRSMSPNQRQQRVLSKGQIHSTSRRRQHRPARSEWKKLSEIADFKRFIYNQQVAKSSREHRIITHRLIYHSSLRIALNNGA
jgi:hypothetical protein